MSFEFELDFGEKRTEQQISNRILTIHRQRNASILAGRHTNNIGSARPTPVTGFVRPSQSTRRIGGVVKPMQNENTVSRNETVTGSHVRQAMAAVGGASLGNIGSTPQSMNWIMPAYGIRISSIQMGSTFDDSSSSADVLTGK